MPRKGTAGRTPEKQVGAPESGIDQMINKAKNAFDGDNAASAYEEEKGRDQQEEAKEYSKKVAGEGTGNVHKSE